MKEEEEEEKYKSYRKFKFSQLSAYLWNKGFASEFRQGSKMRLKDRERSYRFISETQRFGHSRKKTPSFPGSHL
jgi:hypothetical protein